MNNELNKSEKDLQRDLSALVDFETSHIHADVMTNKIVRAIRRSHGNTWNIEDVWSGALLSWFRPVALIGTFLVLLLAAYNISYADETQDMSTTERLFGMHPVTLAVAYDLDMNHTQDEY